jgi:hypothetical protein
LKNFRLEPEEVAALSRNTREGEMSNRNIDVARHNLPEPLDGWYWTCACDKCWASTKTHHYGPFNTKRRARADGMKTNSAAPVVITMKMKKVGETPTGSLYEGHIANIRGSTEEWARKASLAMLSPDSTMHH